MSENKELYLNFDEYIRQGEPEQRVKAGYWQTACMSKISQDTFWKNSTHSSLV